MQPEITTDAPQIPLGDLILAKDMADVLHRHYPGHLWAVTCEGSKGIATVRNLMLSGNWGFVIKLRTHYSASSFAQEVMRAGGELLERYRLARTKADNEQLAHLPVDFAGRHAFEHG